MDAGLDPSSTRPPPRQYDQACPGCDRPMPAAGGWCPGCDEVVVGYPVSDDDPLDRPLPPRVAALAAEMAANAIARANIAGRIAAADARIARIDAALARLREDAA